VAEAAARRPSLLADLPGYAARPQQQAPLQMLQPAATAAAAASALAAPQISGTGASLLQQHGQQHGMAAVAAAVAAAAHANAQAKPHVVPHIQAPSLLGGAQAAQDGAAADDSDDADDDEAPAIQMEMEMEDEEEPESAADQSKKISELVKHSGSGMLKPKASIGASNGVGMNVKEEMDPYSSEDDDDVENEENPVRTKSWNRMFREGAIYKVRQDFGMDLYESIMAENRATAAAYWQNSALTKKMTERVNENPHGIYREIHDVPGIEETMERCSMVEQEMTDQILEHRAEQTRLKVNRAEQVRNAQQRWAESVEEWENSAKKKKQDEKHREVFERAFPDLKGTRATVAANSRSGWLSAPPPPPDRVLRGSGGDDDKRVGISIPPCKMRPAEGEELIEANLNESNVLPNCFEEHKRRIATWQHRWAVRERNAFKIAFQGYPKNFAAIASHLPEKSTQNCVQFYYMTKLDNPSFKICHRQYQNKKRRKANNKPYKPPTMPNDCEVATIHASVQDSNDRLPPAPAGKQPELKCSSCAVVMEPSTASTTRITRANLEALGVDAENSRICEKCRVLAANSRGGRCPIKGCTGSKRKVKSSKPFPPEYVRLEENEKKFILEQIEIHIDTVKICHLCTKRIIKEVQRLKTSSDYDDAFDQFCRDNGLPLPAGAAPAAAAAVAAVCKSEESVQPDELPAAAAATAATPAGRKGSARSDEQEERAWTDDETARLLDLNGKLGDNWKAIAAKMRGRNEEECRLQLESSKQGPPPRDEDHSPAVKEEVQSEAGDRAKEEEEEEMDAEKRSSRSTTPPPGLVPLSAPKSSARSDAGGAPSSVTAAAAASTTTVLQQLQQVKEEPGVKQELVQPLQPPKHTPTIVAPIPTHPTQQQQQQTQQQQLQQQALQQPMHSVMQQQPQTSSAAAAAGVAAPQPHDAAFHQQIVQQHLAQQQQQNLQQQQQQQLLSQQLVQQLMAMLPAGSGQAQVHQLLQQMQQQGVTAHQQQQQQQQQANLQVQQMQQRLAAAAAAAQAAPPQQQQTAHAQQQAQLNAMLQGLLARPQGFPSELQNMVRVWLHTNNQESLQNIQALGANFTGGVSQMFELLQVADLPEAQAVLRAERTRMQQQQQQQQYEMQQRLQAEQRRKEEERQRKEKEEREERERQEREKREREQREEMARRERQQQQQMERNYMQQFMANLPGSSRQAAPNLQEAVKQLLAERDSNCATAEKLMKELPQLRTQITVMETRQEAIRARIQEMSPQLQQARVVMAQLHGHNDNAEGVLRQFLATAVALEQEYERITGEYNTIEQEKAKYAKKIVEVEANRTEFIKRGQIAQDKANALEQQLRSQQLQQQAQVQAVQQLALQQQQQVQQAAQHIMANSNLDQAKLLELIQRLGQQNPTGQEAELLQLLLGAGAKQQGGGDARQMQLQQQQQQQQVAQRMLKEQERRKLEMQQQQLQQ
ncbi:hypothetical protein PENTCL1PPCAC_10318, partial [Pristionchus entomophagus]